MRGRRVRETAAFLVLAMLSAATLASGQGRGLGRPEGAGAGRRALAGEPPAELGALRGADAVAALAGALGQRVRDRGEATPEQYAALLAADASVWITDAGQLMFVDVIEHEAGPGGDADDTPSAPSGPAPAPQGYQSNGLPLHHSKPGAPFTIYLDFDGEVQFRSSAWGMTTRTLTGLTIDADPLTFNLQEQEVVSRTWGRVAEDWLPFDVDVTTERPPFIGATVLWSIVTRGTDAGFGSGVAGVSLFNLGYMPFGLQTPTFTFWDVLGSTRHGDLGDVITQEGGHMFGLLHDGLLQPGTFAVEYYGGHGSGATSWGPVMGSPVGRNVTQWSRGEYPGAINGLFANPVSPQLVHLQDDIAIIGGRLGFRSDDFPDAIAGALALQVPTAGVITSPTDVDVFALPPAGAVHIDVTPFRAGELTDGGNLDVAADILDATGAVVASADDPAETAASLTVVLPPGPHYLRVRPSSDPSSYQRVLPAAVMTPHAMRSPASPVGSLR